jgi:hypothetical protein
LRNQSRHPKGTTTGGQFAPNSNPEASVDLKCPVDMDAASIIDRIHRHLDDNGNYDPNDDGVVLLQECRFDLMTESETVVAVAWAGTLRYGDIDIDVSNSGYGTPNDYSCGAGRHYITELAERVEQGFPRLGEIEESENGPFAALDGFCLVAEVSRLS